MLDVSVNGERSTQPILFLQGAGGTLYANRAAFHTWRIRLPAVEPVTFEGEAYYPLRALTALDVRLSEADQSVTIRAPASAFEARVESLDRIVAGPMNLPATGAFINYDLVAEHVGDREGGVLAVQPETEDVADTGDQLVEAEQRAQEERVNDARQDPDVAAILARFPGARITDVRIRTTEEEVENLAPAAAESEDGDIVPGDDIE